MKIAVSACLLGCNCKYNGKNNFQPELVKLLEEHDVFPICPEVMGGMSTPRIPCEIVGDKVLNKEGLDCTHNFKLGAQLSLDICKAHSVEMAILKEGSPSCGIRFRYDGTFSNIKVNKMGICAQLFSDNGILLYNESEIIGKI